MKQSGEQYWDDEISGRSGATIFHSSAWAKVLEQTYGFEPKYLNDDRVPPLRGSLPVMEASSWLRGKRGISLPFTDECTPLCTDQAAFEQLRIRLDRLAAQRKWRYWEIRGGRNFLPNCQASSVFWGHKLNLSQNKAALFSHLDGSTRRAVRKGEQSGLHVEFTTSFDGVQIFYRLLGLTRRRHGLPPQPYAFFENIRRHILEKNLGVVALARYHGSPVAGLMFFRYGSSALYKFGASDESFQHLRPNNLLMWRAIEWHADRGCDTMDFGRTAQSNLGLRQFKCGWGATERNIEYFRYDRRKDIFVTSSDDTSGWHNLLFRMMPLTISRAIGSIAYKHTA